ncbi:MAG: trypsin-like peptidase domain-containing protein [Thermoplasmatota archaeon]
MLRSLAILPLLLAALAPSVALEAPFHGDADPTLAAWLPAGLDCLLPVQLPLPPDSPTEALPEPTAQTCSGIRPGAKFSNRGCTMAFVLTDLTDTYVATAGHCVREGQRMSAHGVGAFGTVVFDSDGLDRDFALIKVDADKRGLVNPAMCRWGGPTTMGAPGVPGALYRVYGWGGETRHHDDTRARSGVELMPPNALLAWEGRVSPGDSGGPVMSADGRAMGVMIVTARLGLGSVGGEPLTVGAGVGTSLASGLALAQAAGIGPLVVVPGGPLRVPDPTDLPEL